MKRGGFQQLKPINASELRKLRAKGWKLRELAEHFDCGIDHITVAIRKNKIPLKGGGRRSKSRP
jgi:hypothetical protein